MARPARFSVDIGVGAKLTCEFEARQVTRRAAAVAALVLMGSGCGSFQRVGSPDSPRPGSQLPRLFDATSVYRSMGFLASSGPLPFVASIRYLRGPAPDSTLALFSLSLANSAITFQRSGTEFVAEYRVEATFRGDSGLVATRQIARDEQVRVRRFQETLRGDESIIFQQFVTLAPGAYTVSVMVRNRNPPLLSRGLRAGRRCAGGGAGGGRERPRAVARYRGAAGGRAARGRDRRRDARSAAGRPGGNGNHTGRRRRHDARALSRQFFEPVGDHQLRRDGVHAALLRRAGMGRLAPQGAACRAPHRVAELLEGHRSG